jgi:hypothetical protein
MLQGSADPAATFVLVPASVMKTFRGRIRVPVRITINGVEHRTTICNMGMGPMIGVPAAMRKAAGVDRGQRITVRLEVDERDRTVDVPQDFGDSMNASERRAYDGLAYTQRKEFVLWIEQAKKPETRSRRIERILAKLREYQASHAKTRNER